MLKQPHINMANMIKHNPPKIYLENPVKPPPPQRQQDSLVTPKLLQCSQADINAVANNYCVTVLEGQAIKTHR